MNKGLWLFGIVAVVASVSASAQLLDTTGDVELGQTNAEERAFTFAGGNLLVNLSVETHPGTVTVDLRAPDGAQLGSQTAGVLTMDRWRLAAAQSGRYTLVVTPHQTAGHWRVRIEALPPKKILYEQLLSSGLMILVAVASAGWWQRRAQVQWRWFWAGAGIWTVGVALKFAVAVLLNPFFVGTGGRSPRAGLVAGCLYCGLMTGIFEIGATLAAALIWRPLAAEPKRAVAVGLGAGAFEALLLGLASAVGCLVALAAGQGDQVLESLAGLSATTPLFWLAGPIERVIAIATHTAARVLVLQSVARRGWFGFWAGFTWLSVMDLVAGAALLTGMTKSGSVWWIELMILPLGLLSIPLIQFALPRWPQPVKEAGP
jgi:uncharacterized membrane protein YhfC